MSTVQILNKASCFSGDARGFLEIYKSEILKNQHDINFIMKKLAKKFKTCLDSLKLMFEVI